MSPAAPISNSSSAVVNSFDNSSSTPHMMASTNEEEGETSTTHHEPILLVEVPETETMKDRRLIADMADRAHRRASAQSNVLSRTKVADIALISMDEISIGQWLGKGSFSNVHEISKIELKDDVTEMQSEEGTKVARNLLASNYLRRDTAAVSCADADKERSTCRYAVKFLKKELRENSKKYAVGTSDLVVEGLFLASLTHPNIIKVRGLPAGGVHSMVNNGGVNGTGYFLILDRLFDTLSERIYKHWLKDHMDVHVKKENVLDRLFKSKMREEMNSNLAVRVKVAFDIAAALKYLHEKNIIYRDLKPENLGFDVRGDIKLFDLGLVKELHPERCDAKGNWKLSMAGTPRYMSPECGLYKPYNLSADVYSFSMLLWEIISLHQPFKGFSYSQLKREVFHEGHRPPLKQVWHRSLRSLIAVGWHHNPSKRPGMDEIYDKLRTLYTVLKPGCVYEEEISHNRRRSTYINQRLSKMSLRHLMTVENKE